MKQPSQKYKIKSNGYLKQRDGPDCFYCKKPNPNVIDHLNNNRNDNRLENYVRSHQTCNTAKRFNYDYQIMADEKLRENELSLFIPVEDNESEECSTEIKIATNNFAITEQYTTERALTDGSISWHDSLYGSVYQCKRKTGYGSVPCVRNYLYTLTCPEGPLQKIKDKKGKPILVLRNKN